MMLEAEQTSRRTYSLVAQPFLWNSHKYVTAPPPWAIKYRSVLYTHPTQPVCAAVVFISMLVGNLGCIHTDVHSKGALFTAMMHTDRECV